jgi:hypothetical protein
MRAHRVVRRLQGNRFVYCAQSWQRAAALTALRIPITSPPVTAETFDPTWMENKAILYFKLHGHLDRPDWYGLDQAGRKVPALTPDLVRKADLTGAIVVAAVCYGAGSEMQKAFFEAGARAFFGSFKEVRGRERHPGEVDVLVKHLLSLLVQEQDLPDILPKARELYYAAHRPLSDNDIWTLTTFTVVMPEMGTTNVTQRPELHPPQAGDPA